MSKKIHNYLIFDWETGGLSSKTNPVTEFGCIVIKGTTYEQVLAYDNIIKPYDDKLIYEPKAIELHGLSKEVCQRDGINLSQWGEDFKQICTEGNTENSKIARPMVVGQNITFDIPFLQDCARRCKIDLSQYISGYFDHLGNFVPHYIDIMHLSKNVDGHSQDKTIKFNLTEIGRRVGVRVIDGHRAMNDVIATVEVFINYMTRLRSGHLGVSKEEMGVSSYREKFEI